ncbi:hypothetical protein PUNSTDRAFT_128632 [Punctularia strigosozonata HHB-11173 SS5]|uniref:Metal homeostatis protein bsd2 n=1 Tax=Punctularia strigosozonata (strain HHB-11173) TaxID=741275 RepID=R7S1H2_PUNST|nr:uncharacterized protein PUNSTDRAFT_128632 [Punctularia strigosozonata HHB-11173 SS5]EIN03694.1 hypothetical protein PUNSTDRAFT_128632 [Punctularia strigosozonata HHB-11173 SS5]
MPARYAPLPNPRSLPDREQELEAAFESDGEDDQLESTPLTRNHTEQSRSQPAPGTYDFERDYDYDRPPPGSPPRPADTALPNAIGNSNGLVPDDNAVARPRPPRPSFFRKAVGALLPTHYARVPASEEEAGRSGRVIGGGVQNDGVFANVTAKPGRQVPVTNEQGDVHMVPEEAQRDAPPSYASAQADAVPPYWETTVLAPGSGFGGEMIVEDLPVGSLATFVVNCFISFFFQFVGFVMTYLLHTSHAAKFGSRAGLGLTMIQFGFYSRNQQMPVMEDDTQTTFIGMGTSINGTWPPDGSDVQLPDATPEQWKQHWISTREWLSFLLMTVGWFLLLTSLVGFWRVKRWELSLASTRQPVVSTQVTPEDEQRMRNNFRTAFAVHFGDEVSEEQQGDDMPDESDMSPEARLARNLRAAGFI